MALDSAIEIISRWSSISDNNSYLFSSERDEIDQYLQSVDVIQLSTDSGTDSDQIRAKSAIQIAMLRLADEMRNLLKVNGRSAVNPNSTTYSSTMTDSGSSIYIDDYEYGNTLSVEVIGDLRSIVNRMNGAGYLRDCKKAYVSERKRCVDASYQRLEIQKLSSKDAPKMDWEMLETIIRIWMKSAKICFRKIFPYEKQLCEEIFTDLENDTNVACFLETVNDYAFQLLDIATNLSSIKIAAERLFGISELYKTFFDLLPEISKIFNSQSFRLKEADQIVSKLAVAASMAMEKFEKSLLTFDLSNMDKIHSMCKYVMNYVLEISRNKQTLMKLSLSNPPSTSRDVISFTIVEPQLQNKLPFHMIWIIMCWVYRLEDKEKSIKNASEFNIFLMHHFRYIDKKINEIPEVKDLIGDECFKKISGKLDQPKTEYLRLTFAKVLSVLGDKTSLQKRLKRFNAEFKKLEKNLTVLKVPDFHLQKDLHESVEKTLVPVYSSFLEELGGSPRLMVDVKFSVEELKKTIFRFFPL